MALTNIIGVRGDNLLVRDDNFRHAELVSASLPHGLKSTVL